MCALGPVGIVDGGVDLIVSKKMERMMDGETVGPKPSLRMRALTNNRNFQDSRIRSN